MRVLVAVLALGALLLLSGPARPALAAPGVPRQETPRAQLDYACGLKTAMRGRKGEERTLARERAIQGYRAVHTFFPSARAARAEAAFRTGELLRSAQRKQSALAEFERAQANGEGTEWRARAGLEIGHLHRRASRLSNALTAYESVALDAQAAARHRDRAAFWVGRVHERLGRHVAARRSFEHVAREGADPFERIRAFDAWALSLIAADDLEGAAGVLDLCRRSLSERALEETLFGERLRAALESMRSVERLAAAIAARRRLREHERSVTPPRSGAHLRLLPRGRAQPDPRNPARPWSDPHRPLTLTVCSSA